MESTPGEETEHLRQRESIRDARRELLYVMALRPSVVRRYDSLKKETFEFEPKHDEYEYVGDDTNGNMAYAPKLPEYVGLESDARYLTPCKAAERKWDELYTPILTRYAKAVCLKIARRLLKLPPELRDMVYTYLQPTIGASKHHTVFVTNNKQPPEWFVSAPATYRSFWQLRPIPYCMSSAYVGQQIAREMAEHYYRTGVFLLKADTPRILVERVLTIDRFGLGCDPANLIHRVDFSFDMAVHDMEGPDHQTKTLPSPSQNTFQSFQKTLEELYRLRSPACKINITVLLASGKARETIRQFCQCVRCFLPVAKKLKEVGEGRVISLDLLEGEGNVKTRKKTNSWRIRDYEDCPIEKTLKSIIEEMACIRALTESSKQSGMLNAMGTNLTGGSSKVATTEQAITREVLKLLDEYSLDYWRLLKLSTT